MSRSIIAATALAAALARATQPAIAAEAMPKFDIERNCRAELAGGSAIGETMASCTADEERARDELAPQWATYSKAAKANCLRETTMDGTPSYVELQTCLEMTVPIQSGR